MQIDEVGIGDTVSMLNPSGEREVREVIGIIKGYWWDNVCHGDRIVVLEQQSSPPYTYMANIDPNLCTIVSKKSPSAKCTCDILKLMASGCKCGHMVKS